MSNPMMAIVNPIWRDELPLDTCSTIVLDNGLFAMLSETRAMVSLIPVRVLVVGISSD
jgi:hypothetical protein